MRKRDGFYLIRYEDLVLDPKKEMRNMSKFLDINYNESLTVPTIMGVPDRPNISDVKDKNRRISGVILRSPVDKYKKSLAQEEIKDITVESYNITKSLGYKIEALPNFYKLFRHLPLKTKIRRVIQKMT